MCRFASRSSDVAGVARSGGNARWCTLMPIPSYCVGQAFGVGSCLDENASGLARADEKIVGPAEIDSEAGDGVDGIGGGQARGQRKKRQARGGKLRAQKNADVEAFAGGGNPAVIAAAAAGQLLVG